MSAIDVRELVSGSEGEAVEFKTSLSDTRKIIETAAAMATRGGGVILIGVRDDGTPVGTQLGEGELERLVQQILANTDPRLYVHVSEPVLEGRKLLRIDVPPGDGPHLAFGRAFHRVGRATVGMSRDEYERRLLDRLRESSGFERRRVDDKTTAELDPRAVADWVALARERLSGLAGRPTPDEVAERLHVRSGPMVTVAGWLLFSAEPEGLLPQATIRASAERGGGSDVRAIGGPLFRQIDDAFQFVSRNVRVRTRVVGARRVETSELPMAAVREVIANAVAHRDYRSTAAIQLRLSDEGLEVWNPGALPPPITPALLRERHPSVPPNPLLARALFLAGYIEEWGTGTLKVIQAMKENGNPEALFDTSDGAGVRVILPMKGAPLARLSRRQTATLGRLARKKEFRSADYARWAKIALRTAVLELKSLESLGIVQRVGQGRSTRWRRT